MQFFVVSLLAEDIPACAHFYRDVLGFPLVSHHGSRPHFDMGGSYLVILPGKPAASSDRFPLAAFKVEDLDRKVKSLQDHRIDLPWGIESDSGSRWAMFHDPAGNLIELVQLNSSQK